MLGSLVTPVRELYLQEFRAAVARHLGAHLEPALRGADGGLVLDGQLRLPYRADLIPRDAGGSIMVDTPDRAQIPESLELVAGVPIVIKPFTWDYAHFDLVGTPKEVDWSRLRSCFLTWFDPDDNNSRNEDGFFGVMHCVLDPEPAGDRLRITVDFGSAPVKAFIECVTVLAQTGAQRIEVV